MNRVHITLLGGQTIPVTKCILDDKPELVVMICSNQTKDSAEVIKTFVHAKLKGVSFDTVMLDPTDILKINQSIADINKKIKPGSDITINLTGGTKHWSILFYKYFRDRENVRFILLDQNDYVQDIDTCERRKTESQLDIRETLQLNGIHVERGLNISDYDKSDRNALSVIKDIRSFAYDSFNDLTKEMYTHNNLTKVSLNNVKNWLEWDKETKTFRCQITPKKGKEKKWNVSSSHVWNLMLNNGWFEFEVASLLNQWPAARQVILNCRLKSAKNTTGSILNEIDIIVQTEEKLLFVECKTQVENATDVDKFNNAVRNYGGLSAKRVFFTLAPMKAMAQNKCKQAKIPFFCVETLDTEEKKQALFKKLDNYMNSINEK